MNLKYAYKTENFVYLATFLAELSFFFILPLLGKSPQLSVSNVAACLSGSVILESILLLTTTAWLERFSRRRIITISFLLRSLAFLAIYLSFSLYAWLLFFFLNTISKSISKVFLREILAEKLSGAAFKKSLYIFSLCQNCAVFVAPILAVLALKYDYINLVLILLIIVSICMALKAPSVIYTYPTKKNSSMRFSKNNLRHIFYDIWTNADVRHILLSAFCCFLIMGLFITATTLLDKINPALSGYSGLFFSVVGISICVWQGAVIKLTSFINKYGLQLILLCGLLSATYLIGSIYVAIIALIAYSIYESLLIPELYFKTNHIESNISTTMLFSYLLITANLGQAFGSWLTGLIINHFITQAHLLLFIIIFCATFISFICLKATNHEKI